MASSSSSAVRRVPWTSIEELFYFEHQQGEHVSLVGPTGSGKSTAAVAIVQVLAKRKATDGRPARVTVLGTKPRDSTLEELVRAGWPRVTRWPPPYGQEHVLVWPRYGDPSSAARRQRAVFDPLMRTIFAEGGQTVYIDEASYFEEPPPHGLGLQALMVQYWQQARALDLTLVAGTQRPRRVVRSMWSEPKWLVIFRPEDEDDLKRVAQLSGAKEQVLAIVPELDEHEFLLVRRRGARKELLVSKVE